MGDDHDDDEGRGSGCNRLGIGVDCSTDPALGKATDGPADLITCGTRQTSVGRLGAFTLGASKGISSSTVSSKALAGIISSPARTGFVHLPLEDVSRFTNTSLVSKPDRSELACASGYYNEDTFTLVEWIFIPAHIFSIL